MELVWQKGQVVLNSQNQRKKSPPTTKLTSTAKNHLHPSSSVSAASTVVNTHESAPPQYQLFMQEDEMASWLHYPLDDDNTFHTDFSSHLFYHAPPSSTTTDTITPIPDHSRPPPIPSLKTTNLMRFPRQTSNVRPAHQSQPSLSNQATAVALGESTVVDSSETPTVGLLPRGMDENPGSGSTAAEHDRDFMVTSSSGGSGGSADPSAKPPTIDRKRKGRELDENDGEDTKFEETETKKQARGSASSRRSRAAEVHNLSERRRRDRINEKLKALQELIPRCNKSDKASMLDEAIEYLKSLQLQVQMMSMGCSMMPMVFPGVQPYMGPMGMGMGMGMGMRMEVGMNCPMMPFPHVIAGSSIPRPAAAAHFVPRLPITAYHHPSGSSHDAMRMRPNQDPSLNPVGIQIPNPMQLPFSDSYQRYLSHFNNMQAPPCTPQTHTMAQASTSKGVENQENPKHG